MPAASWKSAGAGSVPDKFPAGLRVLVVDDDPTCLMIIEKMLKKCNYEAIICNKAEFGLSLLRENKNRCDIVLSDVHMPNMDGFKLLQHIELEMDLPVIMMSADDSKSIVMKGVTHGACDYIIKPVRIESLRNIWQHVVRRRQHKWKHFDPLTCAYDVDQRHNVSEDVNHTSSENDERNSRNAKRRIDDEDGSKERDESSSYKKPRVIWTMKLHQQFVAAVNQLGVDKAVPKKILELMNAPGITRESIASHLQKYRMYLKRLSESRHQGSVDTSFLGILDSSNGLRTLTASGQLGQSLATVLCHSNNSTSLFPRHVIDQRNTSRFRQHLHQPDHYSFNNFNRPALMSMASRIQSQSQSQHVFSIRGGIFPSYNMSNIPNQIEPDSDSKIMTFSDLLSHSSPDRMGPTTSFTDNESGTHLDGTRHN